MTAAAITEVSDGTACRNCGTALANPKPKYCAACGQETAEHPPTVWEFGHEFITHYVAIEGRLWHTLGLLFFKPGALTRRYLAGQKRRYVNPLRLYLTASILFFIVVKLFGVGSLVKGDVITDEARFEKAQAGVTEIKKTADKNAPQEVDKKYYDGFDSKTELAKIAPENRKSITLSAPLLDAVQCDNSNACLKIRTFFAERYKDKTIREFGVMVRDRTLSLAPYAMFLFLPVFALLTYLLYWRRRMYYGEHIVYAFHVHAFAYFLLMIMAFANEVVGNIFSLLGAAYFWFAMRGVFGGRWWATTLRYIIIGTMYPLMLVIFVILTMAIAIFI